MDWPTVLTELTAHRDLTPEQAAWAMTEIMNDGATPSQISAFGVALKMKGPSPTEVRALADVMLGMTTPVPFTGRAIDIVGTGGDRSHSVNISTMSAIVVAAAGVKVVKHGNRAASSKSGGADCLEALGVAIGLGADAVATTVEELGIGFCLASVFHSGLRFAGATRREIGIPTVFNVLGPLTNPARPTVGLVGCAFADLAPTVAQAFAERGDDVLVVRGDDGLDELTTASTSTVWRVHGGGVVTETVDPTVLGLPRVSLDDLRGGDAAVNAQVARDLLAGREGPVRDAVLLNSAGALAAYDGFGDGETVTDALRRQLDRASEAVDSGAGADLLERWVTRSRELAAS
ncbi:anthranilate phosphoribosyltransferase [Tsukamurella sp. 8F]|uniref:anthranilate phosphoribosyltransferase n=1 Tax=unclassified Tsukamurella TaxID=2633480 RepID=UPI0023B8EABB|nr:MULTISPECIES: anthranilate phosphoribosyltransferase [unclassified Tsukamurella]MDF0532004.1 anthranilate phosphoribosyltransferase [Tsukamurella sp. 8J]MDF0588409.1 anthranilate phosphoribosyltransferase [Tsukamurella sp. 8F]